MAIGSARRVQGNGMLYMLAVHAATKFMQMPRKPPVTAVLIAVQALIHLRPGLLDAILPTISEVCLNPHLIIQVRKAGLHLSFLSRDSFCRKQIGTTSTFHPSSHAFRVLTLWFIKRSLNNFDLTSFSSGMLCASRKLPPSLVASF